jgi:dsDNA-specific endonuclease/ATPase MutS2
MSKWKPPKSDEVKEQERRKLEFEETLALIAEYLTEDDFQEAIKEFKPTSEQRKEWTMLFRAYQRQKRGL